MLQKQDQAQLSANTTEPQAVDGLRIERAFQLAAFGLGLIAALVVFLSWRGWGSASDVISLAGLFTSVLGTLVGAFFGLQIVAASKQQAEERADTAQRKVEVLQAAADQDTIHRAYQIHPGLFR